MRLQSFEDLQYSGAAKMGEMSMLGGAAEEIEMQNRLLRRDEKPEMGFSTQRPTFWAYLCEKSRFVAFLILVGSFFIVYAALAGAI